MILYWLSAPVAAARALYIVWQLGGAGWRVASSRLLAPARAARRRAALEAARSAYEADDAAFLRDQRGLSEERLASLEPYHGSAPDLRAELRQNLGAAAGFGVVAFLFSLFGIAPGTTLASLLVFALKVSAVIFGLFSLFTLTRSVTHKSAELVRETTLREEREHMRDVQSMVGALSLAQPADASGGLSAVGPRDPRREPEPVRPPGVRARKRRR